MSRPRLVWTPEMERRLRALLGRKATQDECARVLSSEFGVIVSVGAVAGKRSRMGLGRAGWSGGQPRGKEARAKALAASRELRRQDREQKHRDRRIAVEARKAVAGRMPDRMEIVADDPDTVLPDRAAIPDHDGHVHWPGLAEPPRGLCCWPIGDVGDPGFGFCGAATAPDASHRYCCHHDALSWAGPVEDDAPEVVA